jgi:2-aminoethylphosphonate-pyruvate transaminase
MLRQALLLAAGRGRPVADPDIPNCLAKVGGVPLVVRTLRTLARAGVRRVGITVGWQGALVRRKVEELRAAEPPGNLPPEIAFFDNADWEQPNGLSVLAAARFLTEPTLLMMADQVAAPALVARFVAAAPTPERAARTLVGIDRELYRVFDIDDATKVKLRSGSRGRPAIEGIGKALTEYEAVSTSLMVVSPALLDCLRALPRPSLTEGLAEAARRGELDAEDVTGWVWQDVDSAEMRQHAEWLVRAYGEELLQPAVSGSAQSPATDTLALIERLLAEKDAPRYILLNPGPVMTSARVKAALVHHDVCHRDEHYTGIVRRLQTKLRPVFAASPAHDIFLLTGSGTAAMETALCSAVAPGRKILTLANGAFGDRLGDIVDVHGLPHRRMRLGWGEPIDPAMVEALLEADPAIAVVALVRHETSVGLLNPAAAVGRLCAARGVLLIVDAVSALGAEEVDVVADDIDVCLSSSNKCLHAVAGVSFLCVSPRFWQLTAGIAPRSYYLDLRRYKRAIDELGQTPFTPAVSAFFALETALDELAEQGGVPARREQYRRHNLRIRRVLTSLGFQPFTNTGRESVTITTVKVPANIAVTTLYDRLRERGFVIYKGKGPLAADHVQIANMGELTDATIDAFLAALTGIVEEANRAANRQGQGDGTEAAAPRPRLRSV